MFYKADEKVEYQEPDRGTPVIFNIMINHIRVDSAQTLLSIVGLPESHIQDISIENVQATNAKEIQISEAEDIHLNQVFLDGSLLK